MTNNLSDFWSAKIECEFADRCVSASVCSASTEMGNLARFGSIVLPHETSSTVSASSVRFADKQTGIISGY